MKSLRALGDFKNNISTALYNNDSIKELLLGSNYNSLRKEELFAELGKHIFSHEFIDNILENTETNIYYDVTITKLSSTVKMCKLYVYCMCDRKILDSVKSYDYNDDILFGNKADILVSVVDDILSDITDVGHLEFLETDIVKTKECYGRVIVYQVPDFR